MGKVKIGLGCMSVVVVIGVIVNVALWATNRLELMAGLWIGASLGGAVAWIVSGVWSGLLIKSGAEIGSRNVAAEAEVETAKMQGMVEMWKAFRQQARNEPQAPMIGQQQQQKWLPEYPVDGEFEEVDYGKRTTG